MSVTFADRGVEALDSVLFDALQLPAEAGRYEVDAVIHVRGRVIVDGEGAVFGDLDLAQVPEFVLAQLR